MQFNQWFHFETGCHFKGPATRNDFVNDIVNDEHADAIFATLKAIVDDETSTISSTISLRVAWPLFRRQLPVDKRFVGINYATFPLLNLLKTSPIYC